MIVITLMSLFFLLLLYKFGILPYRHQSLKSRTMTNDTRDPDKLLPDEWHAFLKYSKLEDYLKYKEYLNKNHNNDLVAFVRNINGTITQDKLKDTAIDKLLSIKRVSPYSTDPILKQYLQSEVDTKARPLTEKEQKSLLECKNTKKVLELFKKYVLSMISSGNEKARVRINQLDGQIETLFTKMPIEDYVLFFDLFILNPVKGIAWVTNMQTIFPYIAMLRPETLLLKITYLDRVKSERPNSVSLSFAHRFRELIVIIDYIDEHGGIQVVS